MNKLPNTLSKAIKDKFSVIDNTLIRDVKEDVKDRITLEVGDSKQPEFYPQAKIMRWDNEVNASFRYVDPEPGDPVIETEQDRIKYIKPKTEFHAYELNSSEIGEDGGLEIELILKDKPDSNKFDFTIQTKELEFLFQAPLTQEEIDEGCKRDESVVGSYAVYHKSKGGMNDKAGNEYKAGKAFHIYRPEVIDANGNKIYGDLNIDEDKGILTVTVDQNFLDNALYPVIVDPTFGYTSIGATTVGPFGNTTNKVASIFSQLTAGAADTVVQYSLYGLGSAASQTMIMTCYTTVADVPSALLASGSNITVTNVAGWFNSGIVSQALTNGTNYSPTLGFGSLGGNSFTLYYDAGSAPGRINSNTVAFTDPFDPAAGDNGRRYSFYATYITGVPKTFTVDGIVKATVTGTFTVDGIIGSVTVQNNKTFTIDGVIGSDFTRYFLNGTGIPRPSFMRREFIQVKSDLDTINGRTTRDFSAVKEKFILRWDYLRQDEIEIIMAIVNLNTAVTFQIAENNLIVNSTSVLPFLSVRDYPTPAGSFYEAVELELVEVS